VSGVGGGGAAQGRETFIADFSGSGATVSIDNTILTGFDDYKIEVFKITTTAVSNTGQIQFSADNGSTFLTMKASVMQWQQASAVTTIDESDTQPDFTAALGTTDLGAARGIVELINGDANQAATFMSRMVSYYNASDNRNAVCFGNTSTAAAVNYIRFKCSGGDVGITGKVYGVTRGS